MATRDNSGHGSGQGSGQGMGQGAPGQGGPNDKATGPLGHAREEATEAGRQGVGAAQNRIRAVFEQQSHRAADQIGSVAQALHQAAEQLEAENNGTAARYTTIAADRVEQFADTLRNSTVDDLVGQVEGFARRQPEIFLSAAFGIGFLFARFIKSSGERIRMADLTRQQGQSGQPGGGRGMGGGTGGGGGGGGARQRGGIRDAAELMAGGSPEPTRTETPKAGIVEPEPLKNQPVTATATPTSAAKASDARLQGTKPQEAKP